MMPRSPSGLIRSARSTAKLRAEIKRAKDPKPAAGSGAQGVPDAPVLVITHQRLVLDLLRAAQLPADELVTLGAQLTQALKQIGFKKTLITP